MNLEHSFTNVILEIMKDEFGKDGEPLFKLSHLIQYLNLKTVSADRDSKARSSFANLYALYVLIEDYVTKEFHKTNNYKDYEGARFQNLFKRMRELPFGQKLQNHALNHRLNQEFKKYFPVIRLEPIIRESERYWINENLIKIGHNKRTYNISLCVLKIIDMYIKAKQDTFFEFIKTCKEIKELCDFDKNKAIIFIKNQISPKSDARFFEIVSYCILKYFYLKQTVFIGFEKDEIEEENLILYKTGRTNANDGGIDFVMKPLGRFFQVTETTDVKKYFLDIDKIERYPITFVIKSEKKVDDIYKELRLKAEKNYPITKVVDIYMNCIEEIINIPLLIEKFEVAINNGHLNEIINEIVIQSKVEFNIEEEII